MRLLGIAQVNGAGVALHGEQQWRASVHAPSSEPSSHRLGSLLTNALAFVLESRDLLGKLDGLAGHRHGVVENILSSAGFGQGLDQSLVVVVERRNFRLS